MEFLKKNYEKVLLGVVLLGLAGALGYMPIKIANDKEELGQKKEKLIHPRINELSNIDLKPYQAILTRLAAPATIDFGKPNKLFNPMPWQRKNDGTIWPAESLGASAASVTNITPLFLRLTLDQSFVTPDGSVKYFIGIEKQAAAKAGDRTKHSTSCKLNEKAPEKDPVFQLVEVKGKAEDPDQLVLQLLDTGERAVVSKDKPFTRIDGYMASINYDPESHKWKDQRIGAKLSFNGEDYYIVAINQNEVVLSAKSNLKKWTIRLNSASP